MLRREMYVMSDPDYESCIWYTRCFAGLKAEASRYDLAIIKADTPEELPQNAVRTCVLFCSDERWAGRVIRALSRRGIRSVLAGAQPDAFYGVSGTSIDRRQLVKDMVRYLVDNGRTRLACLGVASWDVNDAIRAAAFHNAMRDAGLHTSEADVFCIDQDMDKCVLKLLDRARDYDGVLCVNDQVAVRLIALASGMGVCVPEELFVAGSGNLLLGQMIRPTLTTTDLDYYQMGRKTVDIWQYLDKSPDATAMTVTVEHRLLPRGSTAYLPQLQTDGFQTGAGATENALADETSLTIERLENCLFHCDALDLRILAGIVRGKSLEQIATELFVVAGTVNYRARKLYLAMDVACRRDLQRVLTTQPSDADALEEMARLWRG